MTTLVSRAYAGPQDLTAILALMVSVRPADRIAVYPGIIDLHELLALPEVQANTRLWLAADGAVVAFAIVDHYCNLLFEHTPNAAGLDLESQLVAWGEACVRRTFQPGVASGTLDASCSGEDSERIAWLERNGFIPQEIRTLRMIRPLDEPIPAPQLPEGFSIRSVAGESGSGSPGRAAPRRLRHPQHDRPGAPEYDASAGLRCRARPGGHRSARPFGGLLHVRHPPRGK